MKKKNVLNDKIFRILVIITVILVLTMGIMMFINRYNLDTSSDKVTELYNYLNIKDLTNCAGLINYSDKLVEYKDIDSETKNCIAYNKTNHKNYETETLKVEKKKNTCKKDKMIFRVDEDNEKSCTITKVERDLVDNTYKKIFGKKITDNETIRIDSDNICYLKDDYYYCGTSELSVYTIGSDSSIYRVIREATEKDGEVVIRDFFIRINSKKCYSNYTTSKEISECSKEYTKKKDIDYNFMKKYGTEYVHKYKKTKNNTYYWVSSEPVEK